MANATVSSGGVDMLLTLWTHPFVYTTRQLFYVVTPGESSFATLEEVPNYTQQATTHMLILALVELLVLRAQGRKDAYRSNDALSSVSTLIISAIPLIVFRNVEMTVYVHVYDNWRLYTLPWNSVVTWCIALLGLDLGFYWVHRFAHEINFIWGAHQVHHSSEDFNISTAVRQPAFQRYCTWFVYLPLAFFLPPSVFKVHFQFNLLYQVWIHTQVVERLGPLEWVMNTPSHHRVHHGRNRYCIDTNYAGVFIIWDRMFGTFAAEKRDDKVVYGLVHPIRSWMPIHIQLMHWKYMWRVMGQTAGLTNKLSVLLKGPGWAPGKPRLGLRTDLPDIHAPIQKYDRSISRWGALYTWAHLGVVLAGQAAAGPHLRIFDSWTLTAGILFMLWTLTNIGYIYEHNPRAPLSELLRIGIYLMVDTYVCGGATCHPALYFLRLFFLVSGAGCALVMARSFTISKPQKID